MFVIRWFLRMRATAAHGTFDTVTLLVTVPRFRHKEQTERTGTKEQMVDALASAETFFSTVGGLKAHHGFHAWLFGRHDEVAFEIVAHNKEIRFYVTMPREMEQVVTQQLSAAYPDCFPEAVEDYNIFAPDSVILGSYLVFKREHAFPIKTFRKLDKDPLDSLTNVLAKVPEGEGAAIQLVVRSAEKHWRSRGIAIAGRMLKGMSMEEAISGKKHGKINWLVEAGLSKAEDQKPEETRKLSPLEEETVKGLEEKASKAGLEVCIRLVVAGKTADSAHTTLAGMINAFTPYSIYQYGNSFVKVVPPFKKRLIRRFIYRSFDERNKVVLNAEEMASIWHLPTAWTDTPGIKWLGARKGPAPSNVPTGRDMEGELELGYNVYRGVKTPIWMKAPDRLRHMYVMGKSGAGKSEMIATLAIQDILMGHGVAVIDPHGDLIEHILGNIPKERIDDVIHFNPSDLDRPMGLNMLESPTDDKRDNVASEMISIFYKLFPPEMIGPMFEHQMRNVMLTLMADIKNPGTVAEIPRMFSDQEFADGWVAKVKDPVVRAFWEKEMAKTSDFHKSEMLGYLISKVGRFVENEMMRNIIGQQHSSFNFRQVMDEGKIFLCNLAKGKTGDINADLLGMIIVTKLQMAALERADMAEADRKSFFLYIDEFQNFVTDSIATILSEARKYRLALIIAHQYIGQLSKNNDTKIKDAVFGNVGTMMVARIGPEDVDTLEKVYAPDFTGYDMINSDKFTWYVKMIVDNASTRPFTMNLTPKSKGDRQLAEAIKELSRLKYGRDKAIVEAEIMERTQLGTESRGPMLPDASASIF
ncbi:type IV secretory system conjugative DNA transfer family protein [bacterium]|nr:type IV secretory system conjugative DNA transfer family protein [bacterium]